jgi:hypothetical protein
MWRPTPNNTINLCAVVTPQRLSQAILLRLSVSVIFACTALLLPCGVVVKVIAAFPKSNTDKCTNINI